MHTVLILHQTMIDTNGIPTSFTLEHIKENKNRQKADMFESNSKI